MAATKYTYSIATDFPNHKENSARLISEISGSAIVAAPDHIDTEGDVCDIWMKAALSEGDETLLDGLVAAHSGEPLTPGIETVRLDGPETSDGKPIFLSCMFPGGVFLYPTGAGDHVANQTRGNGPAFKVECALTQEYTVEWQFIDWVYLGGGGVKWRDGEDGDWLSMTISAPASVVVPNGTNTGNCNLVDPGVGQAILIVPANGNGAYDVDLDSAVPVPSSTEDEESVSTPTGFYEWSNPDTGKGVISVGTPEASNYNLFAVAIDMARFANRLQLVDAGMQDLTIPAIKPKKILPQWKFQVKVNHAAGTANFKAWWWVITARTTTV